MREGTQVIERTKQRSLWPVGLLVALAFCAVAPGAAAATGPAPGWRLAIVPYPTNLSSGTTSPSAAQGPGVSLLATNVGGKATSGKFTITDTLPAGLLPSPIVAPFGNYGDPFGKEAGVLSCESSGQTVTCSGEGLLQPGKEAEVSVPLKVTAPESSIVLDEATVEGGGAAPVSASIPVAISSSPAPIGFLEEDAGAYGSVTNADGSTATEAGSHPYQLTVGMNFSNNSLGADSAGLPQVFGGGIRNVSGELPQGMVVNPGATPKCSEVELEAGVCPDPTQIGTIEVSVSFNAERPSFSLHPLYNMVAPPGTTAVLAFEVLEGVYIHLLGRVRSDGDYGLSADVRNVPAQVGFLGAAVSLWGDPSDPSHDHARGRCLLEGEVRVENEEGNFEQALCKTERLETSFVTLPSSCSPEPLETFLRIDNWVGEGAEASYLSTDGNGALTSIDGCNQLPFEPEIEARPTTNLADSPSGLDFDLKQPQELKVGGTSTANLKDTTVSLPTGMALNPSAGAGLEACTPAQLGSDGTKPANCPNGSKIGSVEAVTPLLEEPLLGAVYLAKPFENPFNSLLAIYIAVEDPQTGVVAKLPGKVTADPATGQLTTRVEGSPELPIKDVRLHLFTGPSASLTTPPTCGTYTTTSDLTPWSTPEGADAHPTDTFQTTASPGGGACPTSQDQAPNKPTFTAGTVSPQAGAYSPFVLKLTRQDASQRFVAIDTTLPEGLVGKLAGVSYCPAAGISQALSRNKPNEGALERQSPSCPASSEVGIVDVAAGSGITPLHALGHAYLAGPYKGAPLSMVVITPAVAGPFDLGVVTTRVALEVDPETARIHAVSDPLPQILDGIPLDLRSVSLELGRPNFTLNPTSCDPMAVGGAVTSALGGTAALSSPFQVGGCSALPFKPKLSVKLKGGTKRGDFPALTATATAKPGEANIGRVAVTLPHSAFLEQSHIGTVCTRVQFAEGSIPGEKCPTRSIYGKATLTTPLLDQPLAGPVFLRSSSHQLPDLVVALHGQVDVVVAGKVDSVKGALRNTFEAVPDAPFSKFTLQMQGGKKGLIVNSRNLCASTNKATVLMDGQNGRTNDFTPVVKAKCGGKARKGKRHHKKH
jgi:hypothetical protein